MPNNDNSVGILKTIVNSVISVCIIAVVLLTIVFVLDDVDGTIKTDKAYWTSKVIMAFATFGLMLSVANITEERLKAHKADFIDRIKAVQGHYDTVMQNSETDELGAFATNLNRAEKYSVYIKKHKRRLAVLNKVPTFKSEWLKKVVGQSINREELALIITPDEVWEGAVNVKYHKVTKDQLFATTQDVNDNENENDLQTHKVTLALKKLFYKFLALAAFGAYAGDLAYHFSTFTKEMILPLLIRCGLLLMAAYSGMSFGYTIVDRAIIVLKRKLRIFSQFRKRTDEHLGYEVEIKPDKQIEKLRNTRAVIVATEDSSVEQLTFTGEVQNEF